MMTRAQARLIHLTVGLLGTSGLLLVWMVFLADPPEPPDGEFFALQHPGQTTATELHILSGPALVFLLGLVWSSHICTRIRNGASARRSTGILLVSLFPPLAASGYALQISADESLRLWLGWAHGGLGSLFVATYLIHLLRPKAATR